MKNYLGILGDPAKYQLYDDDFYRILSWDETESGFHLLGASEDGLSRNDYRKMFDQFKIHLNGLQFSPIPNLSNEKSFSYNTRIGLFPSSTSHLIKGPSFSFAPYPVNSESFYLKFKSKMLQFFLKPFLPFKIRSLAYSPLGGKAAAKTAADQTLSFDYLAQLFYNLRREDRFDWYYLEAGSGEEFLKQSQIEQILAYQAKGYLGLSSDTTLSLTDYKDTRIIVPRSIYGGGIRSVEQLEQLLVPEKGSFKLVPELIIIGNISEESTDTTYDILDKLGKINELPVVSINNHH